ncbi:hypothetical protein DM02DRAFT_614456 [Periconia macrospinosa]|uniref:DUF7708 domain-containing protein n=1 Tax=Periconia macrospinosa TaxID=97972 RepID=A0A2V1DQV5_9PLEO|nr:hypothetical protein DM02DRAFT_614456 [Periconia macrospinosa]
MLSQNQWYINGKGAKSSVAKQAFSEATLVFSSHPEFNKLRQFHSLGDLHSSVEATRANYEQKRQDNKTNKWLAKLSSRITYYGRVLDVLVQHHPEYVSLAWGAMKFLFVLVENHEKQVKAFAKGLTRIAEALPRVELASILYPTSSMQRAVSGLYSHIIRFLLRTERWYNQSKLRHAWEAFHRPVELEYNDLVEEVRDCTKEIEDLANAGAQAEQRDMHLELKELGERLKTSEALLQEMRGLLISSQTIQESANLDTNQRLTDLQLNQIMDYLSGFNKMDPYKTLQYRTCIADQTMNRQRTRAGEQKFWHHPKFYAWESSPSPSIIVVKGDYSSRHGVQKFTIDIIHMLRGQGIPVIWALKTVTRDVSSDASMTDIIKDLVCQAMRLNISHHTEGSLALSCAQFRGAESPEEWLALLAKVITCFPRLYIIIDIECLGSAYSRNAEWLHRLNDMLQRNTPRKWISHLKILLVSYGSGTGLGTDLANFQDNIVLTRQPATKSKLRNNTLNFCSYRQGQGLPHRGRGSTYSRRARGK